MAKNPPAMQETKLETEVLSLNHEDPLEEGTATHSSILAWRTPGSQGESRAPKEPGGLPSLASQGVRLD